MTFERYADKRAMLELYDEAVEEQDKRIERHGSLERHAALGERLAELELERKGYLRQNARGVLTDGDLDAMLSEIDALREDINTELFVAKDAASSRSRIQALRSCLLSAEWYEAPDMVQPDEYLSTTASQEEIRRAYRRYGAQFEVDDHGMLTLRMNVALVEGALQLTSSS